MYGATGSNGSGSGHGEGNGYPPQYYQGWEGYGPYPPPTPAPHGQRLSSHSSAEDVEFVQSPSSGLQRSTKGASKARRDMINNAICSMRDLLPLPESARQRLSQLQIMSLACCFIRKSNYLTRWLGPQGAADEIPFEFSQSMTGFMLIMTREGKLLYISENVTEYLGHSMVDMMTQGDSIYDIVDKKDHQTIQNELLQNTFVGGNLSANQRSFFCRMNVSRAFRRQSGIGDHKVMHVKGHFIQPAGDQYGGQPVFMAVCTPLITPDLKETIIQNHTMVFHTVHGLDMKYIELAPNGEFHLGYTEGSMVGKSWYEFIHPEDIHEAKDKHMQLIKSSHEMGCMLTVRMMTAFGQWTWVNVVMHIRQPYVSENTDPAIVCINQIIEDDDAAQYRLQSQLYSSHIARSPEFLSSGGNSPVSIHQVAVDREHMFPYGEVSGALETTIYGEFGFAVAPATTTTVESAPFQVENPVTTYTNLSDSAVNGHNGKRGLKAEIINRLKRKMADYSSNQQACKPTKQPRYMPDFVNDANGGIVVRSAAMHTNYDTGSFSMGGTTDGMVSVMNPVMRESGPPMVSLKSKVGIPHLQRLPTMVLASSVDTTLPPTPMTPDSIKDVDIDTTTSLCVDTMEATVVPPCMPTPEASPVMLTHSEYEVGSPVQAVNSDHTGPLIDADALSLFPEVEVKPPKAIKIEPKKPCTKPLPVLDFGSVTDYLSNLEDPLTSLNCKTETVTSNYRPPNSSQVCGAPAPLPHSVGLNPNSPQASPEDADLVQMSYNQLNILINQVTDVVLECVHSPEQPTNQPSPTAYMTRTPSPVAASPEVSVGDVCGEFMVVPEQEETMETQAGTTDTALSLDYDLLTGITMETQSRFLSQATILDELYQLNVTMPSNGNGDQTNPSC